MGIAEKIYEKLKNAPEPVAQEVLDFLRSLEKKGSIAAPKHNHPMSDYAGCLKDSEIFQETPLGIQHRLRDDWDQKWD